MVLKQALILKELLIKTGRYRVFLTRDKDIFLRLRERVKMAQRKRQIFSYQSTLDSINSKKFVERQSIHFQKSVR